MHYVVRVSTAAHEGNITMLSKRALQCMHSAVLWGEDKTKTPLAGHSQGGGAATCPWRREVLPFAREGRCCHLSVEGGAATWGEVHQERRSLYHSTAAVRACKAHRRVDEFRTVGD